MNKFSRDIIKQGMLPDIKVFNHLFTCHLPFLCSDFVQAQTANIFSRLLTFETARLPLET